MIQKVFGVRDGKALAFLQPFFSASTGAAVRAFSDAVNEDAKSPLAKHPEDYVLYELASFDDNSGEFVCCTPIKMLGCGVDFVQVKSNDSVLSGMVKRGDISSHMASAIENGEKNG